MESFGITRDMVYQLGEPTTDERDQVAFRLSVTYRHAAENVAAEQLGEGWVPVGRGAAPGGRAVIAAPQFACLHRIRDGAGT